MLGKFKEDGYTILKHFFKPSRMSDLRDDAWSIFARQLDHFGYSKTDAGLFRLFKEQPEVFKNCGKHIQHLTSLHSLAVNSSIISMLRTLGLQSPSICTRPVLFFNSKHLAVKDIYHTVPAHQDWASMQGSLDSVVVWMPLVKVTEELGALQVVPGSHKLGLLSNGLSDGFGLVEGFQDDDFMSVELEPGDALSFSSFLVHRSGQNITDKIRWSCHLRYNNLDDSNFIRRGFPHPYIYRPVEL